ncbi:hypothetical protein [Pseudomonas sp. CGJS7]|uniref:hypothetical protein n=1 Tax=Pseudomonas sp. CGJS7 TaxID=3109348 RepID=UPI00300A4D1F
MNPSRLPRSLAPLALLALLLSACGPMDRVVVLPPPSPGMEATAARGKDLVVALQGLCGKAFAGRIVANTPAAADDPFAGKTLVMHVRGCKDDAVRVPFHVGDDHSRTWVFARTGDGLSFKHDHRHRDGSEDQLTQYGGDLIAGDKAGRYEFPADAHSRALFRKLGREVSVPNVWAVEIDSQRFIYELARPGRLFRVEFDLTQPIPAPPPPWGG